jgi:protease PrsW
MSFYIISFLISIIFWLWIIRKYDRFEREPLKTILLFLIIGGLISMIPAGFFNLLFGKMIHFDFDPEGFIDPGLEKLIWFYGFVGINEEFWKAAATVLLIRRLKNFNEPADALVYSMTVAFGFSVFENIDYTARLGFVTFFIRQFNAVPLHIGLAAIWGIGIARAKFIKKGNYMVSMAPYLLIAAFLHFIYNLSATQIISPAVSLILPSVMAIFLIAYAVRKIKRYSAEGPFSGMLICHHCQAMNTTDARICKQCGHELELEFYDLCGTCNARVSKNAEICPKCGAVMQETSG